MRTNVQDINADFTCKNCGRFVTASSMISGVVHRNHCPYCLHSRHVDLFEAGDRLCACKSLMAPVGLTLKRTRDKYARQRGGELMLVHRCTHCGELVINRIAADDDPAPLILKEFKAWKNQEKPSLNQREIARYSRENLTKQLVEIFNGLLA